MADDSPHGAVEAQVRSDVASLGDLVGPMEASFAEIAYSLARRLDDPDEKSPAAVADKMMVALSKLAAAGQGDDDLDGDLSTPS